MDLLPIYGSSVNAPLRHKYFPSVHVTGVAEVGVTDDLLHLKNLCSKSKGKSKASSPQVVDFSPTKEDDLLKVATEMLAKVSKRDGVSTFLFIGSGVADVLLNYLSCGCFSKKRVSKENLPKLHQQALKRYQYFIAVTLPYGPSKSNLASMSVLVPASLLALVHHLVHVNCVSAERMVKSLRDYSSNILLIDPLACLSAVVDFVWPRVQGSESSHKSSTSVGNSESSPTAKATRHQSTRSRSGINIGNSNEKGTLRGSNKLFKVKGKVVLKPTQDEGKGPRTRNAS
ncbi:hypothetical protein Tco_1434526 [Tanacetum coccineum]